MCIIQIFTIRFLSLQTISHISGNPSVTDNCVAIQLGYTGGYQQGLVGNI